MKVYDIALVLIRALMALDIVRELAYVAFDIVRGSLIVAASNGSSYIDVVERTQVAGPIFGALVSLLILANGKRLARFAAKLSVPVDAAALF